MPKTKPVRDLALAVTQLTIVPLPVRWPSGGRPDVASWYPLVGVVLGGTGWLVLALPSLFGVKAPELVVSALAVALLAVLTRGLHWDGLADVADAWHQPTRERRHEVMKDSATGAFGALAIALVALLEVAALAALTGANVPVVLVFAVVSGRLAATFSAWLGKPARPDGLGAAVIRPPSVAGAFAVALAMGAAALVLVLGSSIEVGAAGLIAVFGLGSALVVPHLVAGRFGGVSGDTLGASIMVVEMLVLVVASLLVAS